MAIHLRQPTVKHFNVTTKASKWVVGVFQSIRYQQLFQLVSQSVRILKFLYLIFKHFFFYFGQVTLENFLLKRFSTRTLYFFSFLTYAVFCGCIYFQTSIYAIMPLCSCIGVLLTSLVTLPYQMLSEFHKDKNYRKQSAAGTKRGLGIINLRWLALIRLI